MEKLHQKRIALLKEELNLVKIEEEFEKNGDARGSRSVSEARSLLYEERMAVEARMKLKVVGIGEIQSA